MFVGELTQGQVTQLWQINLVRRLDNPDGSFAGVIAASYDTNSFTRFYREVDLGSARTDRRGQRARRRMPGRWPAPTQSPTVISIADTPTLRGDAAVAPRGAGPGRPVWTTSIGCMPSRPFRTHDLKVVVGVDRAEAMRAGGGVGDERAGCSPAASRC